MKNCKSIQRQFIFLFNNKTFEIDLVKLFLVLKKLNISQREFKTTLELEKFLKRNDLLIEEFLEFISIR